MSDKLTYLARTARWGERNATRKLAMIALCNSARDTGEGVDANLDDIMDAAECAVRTAKTIRKELADVGLLVVIHEGGAGRHDRAIFQINVKLLQQLASKTLCYVELLTRKKGAMDAPLSDEEKGAAKGAAKGAIKGATNLSPPLGPPLSPHTPLSPPIIPPTLETTDDRGLDPHELWDQLSAAANGALYPLSINLQVVSEPIGWLKAGADLELDVLPTVRAMAGRCKHHSVRSWSYFAGAVADARDRRLKGLPAPSPEVPMRPPPPTRADAKIAKAREFKALVQRMVDEAKIEKVQR